MHGSEIDGYNFAGFGTEECAVRNGDDVYWRRDGSGGGFLEGGRKVGTKGQRGGGLEKENEKSGPAPPPQKADQKTPPPKKEKPAGGNNPSTTRPPAIQ